MTFLGLRLVLPSWLSTHSAKVHFRPSYKAALTDQRTADTPMELHLKLRPTDGEPLPDPTRYRQLVGGLGIRRLGVTKE